MSESLILVVGDTHGNAAYLQNTVLPSAARAGVCKVVQVGDFGYVFPGMAPDNPRVLQKLSKVCAHFDLDLHFLPGNHEDYDSLNAYEEKIAERSPEGHVPLAERVFYTGKVSRWDWFGQRFAAVGGAVSIDKAYRADHLKRTGTRIWWPDEELKRSELDRALQLAEQGPVDVLFTHDAPSYNPFRLIPDLDSAMHRQLMDQVGRAYRPKLWFHGHYHQPVEYTFEHDLGTAAVYGLDCDGAPVDSSTQLLRVPAS